MVTSLINELSAFSGLNLIVPPESTVGTVEGVGFADDVTVSGVVCGLVVVEGGGDVREVVVLGVVSKVNFRNFEVKFD